MASGPWPSLTTRPTAGRALADRPLASRTRTGCPRRPRLRRHRRRARGHSGRGRHLRRSPFRADGPHRRRTWPGAATAAGRAAGTAPTRREPTRAGTMACARMLAGHTAHGERSRHERHRTGSRMVVGLRRQVVPARAVDRSRLPRVRAEAGPSHRASGLPASRTGPGQPASGAGPPGVRPPGAAAYGAYRPVSPQPGAYTPYGQPVPTADRPRRPTAWPSPRSSAPAPASSSSPSSLGVSSASSPGSQIGIRRGARTGDGLAIAGIVVGFALGSPSSSWGSSSTPPAHSNSGVIGRIASRRRAGPGNERIRRSEVMQGLLYGVKPERWTPPDESNQLLVGLSKCRCGCRTSSTRRRSATTGRWPRRG